MNSYCSYKQVLPFLMLGLGVDDMFLLACHFAHVSNLQYIPIEVFNNIDVQLKLFNHVCSFSLNDSKYF